MNKMYKDWEFDTENMCVCKLYEFFMNEIPLVSLNS